MTVLRAGRQVKSRYHIPTAAHRENDRGRPTAHEADRGRLSTNGLLRAHERRMPRRNGPENLILCLFCEEVKMSRQFEKYLIHPIERSSRTPTRKWI